MTGRGHAARFAGVLAGLLLAGCLDLEWGRVGTFRPLPPGATDALEPGMELGECLELLGAPLFVWERSGDGTAVAWGGAESTAYGLSVSVPVADETSASFTFDSIRADLDGVVAAFGPNDRVTWIRRGALRELVPTGRRRPSTP